MSNEENQSERVRVTISLGNLELQLSELLGLRAGSEIVFDRPETFEGTLELEGAPWANVQVVVTPESARVKVLEILDINPKKSSSREETFDS